MRTLKHTNGKRLVDFILHRLRIKGQNTVPVELQKAIDECRTEEQLTALLFATDFVKDEAILKAFDRQYELLGRRA